MRYTKPHYLSREEQVDAWTADLLADAASAERQAAEGPLYPEKGLTAESLRAYASEQRAKVATPEAAKASLRAAIGPDPRLAYDGYWR